MGLGEKSIGIVNYGAGNIFSLTAALHRLHIKFGMVDNAAELNTYSHIIIPGVGHAGSAMAQLKATGMVPAIKALKQPVLGICVGMQLLSTHSEEGDVKLLDIIPINTCLFNKDLGIKIPHMGWNTVHFNDLSLFEDIPEYSQFYFVHSYYLEYSNEFTSAVAEYGQPFSAAIQYKNFYGVQFHPEKSAVAGEQILLNFIKIESCI